jgi:cell division protein FtsL
VTLRATLLWLGLTVGAGTALYVVKHQVQDLEDRLAVLDAAIAKDRDAIHVLHAEWAFLTQPERLAGLARRHLDLVAPRASQIVDSVDRIPMAPGEPDPGVGLTRPYRPVTTARSTP